MFNLASEIQINSLPSNCFSTSSHLRLARCKISLYNKLQKGVLLHVIRYSKNVVVIQTCKYKPILFMKGLCLQLYLLYVAKLRFPLMGERMVHISMGETLILYICHNHFCINKVAFTFEFVISS